MNRTILHIGFSKGGVKKTTTAIGLALYNAECGRTVLVVDNDGQGDVGRKFGVDGSKQSFSTADLYLENGHAKVMPIKVESWQWRGSKDGVGQIYVIPANSLKLSDIAKRANIEDVLEYKKNLQKVADSIGADVVIIDTPPSLDINQMSGLSSATHTILPLSCDFESCGEEKLNKYNDLFGTIKRKLNPAIKPPIVVLTDVDARGNLVKNYVSWVRKYLGTYVLDEQVEHSTAIPNAFSSEQRRAVWFKPKSGNDSKRGSDYRKFLTALMKRIEGDV